MSINKNLIAIASLSCLVLSACASQPSMPSTVPAQSAVKTPLPSPVVADQPENLNKAVVDSYLGAGNDITYLVGAGDMLSISVYQFPEFSGATGQNAGIRVDNSGAIQLPLLGSVPVAGKTVEQIRQLLEQRLARYIKKPSVTVQVVQPNSLRYYLLGEFKAPGMKTSDRPMNLLEALSLGGSIDTTRADLRGAYITRSGQKLPVNFYRLLKSGDMSQNVRLQSGDTVVVPDSSTQMVFVFGGVSKAGAMPMLQGRLDLLQALAQAGMTPKDYANSRLEDVRIIRSEGDRGQFITVNAERIIQGQAAPFLLQPGDVVFVPQSKLANWNQAIEQMLPSLQAVSNILSPFVQIKYLKQ